MFVAVAVVMVAEVDGMAAEVAVSLLAVTIVTAAAAVM